MYDLDKLRINIVKDEYSEILNPRYVELNIGAKDKLRYFGAITVLDCGDLKCDINWIDCECCFCIFKKNLYDFEYLDDNGRIIEINE